MVRLASKLTQISKPLLSSPNQTLITSQSVPSTQLFKRSISYSIKENDRFYKRGIVGSESNRVKSVLLGNGRRAYSTNVETQQKPTQVVGAQLTGSHIRPMEPGNDGKVFGYFMLGINRTVLSTGIRLLVLKLLYSWSANARVMALASVEIDLAPIPVGKTITITFRGKPVFIKHRTPKEIVNIKNDEANLAVFRDPELDADRFPLNPEWTVVLAICTHLGCVPVTDSGRWNAFFCPCHGSHYDASGRIRAGPAPLNLAVPPMKFTENGTLILG